MNSSSSSTTANVRILKLSSCNHIHSSFSALSFSDCCNLCFLFTWSFLICFNSKSLGILWFIQVSYYSKLMFVNFYKNWINQMMKWNVSLIRLDQSLSKTNTNCGLDRDRKNNVTTQILRITFLQKIAFTRTNQKSSIYLHLFDTAIYAALEFIKRSLQIRWHFYRINCQ